jgi:hypothetical protein
MTTQSFSMLYTIIRKVEKQGNFELYTDERINDLRDRLAHQVVWEQGVIE